MKMKDSIGSNPIPAIMFVDIRYLSVWINKNSGSCGSGYLSRRFLVIQTLYMEWETPHELHLKGSNDSGKTKRNRIQNLRNCICSVFTLSYGRQMKINTAKTKLRSGFTLIELIIVLVLFGGIATVGGAILYFIFRWSSIIYPKGRKTLLLYLGYFICWFWKIKK